MTYYSETRALHIMEHGTTHKVTTDEVGTIEVKAKVRDMGFKEKAELRMGLGDVLLSVSLPKDQCLQHPDPFIPVRRTSLRFDGELFNILAVKDFDSYWRVALVGRG